MSVLLSRAAFIHSVGMGVQDLPRSCLRPALPEREAEVGNVSAETSTVKLSCVDWGQVLQFSISMRARSSSPDVRTARDGFHCD
jgi:hypothetical protein